MQKNFGIGLNFKFAKAKFLHNFFWHVTTSLCTIVFRADTGNW